MVLLETPRLQFRYHEERDRHDACALDMDARFRHPFAALSLEEANRSFESFLVRKPMMLLATVYRTEDRYIGRCGLYPVRDDRNEIVEGHANLAFYLHPDFWGRGLATEAGRAFVEYGFRELGLKRIVAGASVKNLASNRVIEKVGLTYVASGGKGEEGGPAWHEYEVIAP